MFTGSLLVERMEFRLFVLLLNVTLSVEPSEAFGKLTTRLASVPLSYIETKISPPTRLST